MTKITKHILVLSGATLGVCVSYTPVPKKLNKEAAVHYLDDYGRYSGIKSEERKKQILEQIGNLRAEVRRIHQQELLKREQIAHEAAEDLLSTVSSRTRRRISNAMYQASKKYQAPKELLEPLTEHILRKNGIVVCDLNDSIFV